MLLFFLELQEESDLIQDVEELELLKNRCNLQLEINYQDLAKAFKKNHKDSMTFLSIKRKFLDRLISNIDRRIEYIYDNA